MAETIGLLILSAAGAGEITGIAGLGTLAGTTIAGTSVATIVGTAAIIGVSIGLQYALNNPEVPKPENGSQPIKQSYPPRIRGYGTNRLAGSYMLFEAGGGPPATSYDVQAFHAGRITGIAAVYLSDDQVGLSGDINSANPCIVTSSYADGRYGFDAIKLEARFGVTGQVALVIMTSDPSINGIWTPAHRGDGIAYVGMVCGGTNDPNLYTQVYPRGKPELSLVVNCSPCFDPRSPSQNRFNPATWTFTRNPIIQLIDYLTRTDGGMGLDYAEVIAPNLAAWINEANLCDVPVSRSDGTSEARYCCDGWFNFDTAPENIINNILSTCDGWLAEAGDGSLQVVVGYYREPTDPPLTERHIRDFALSYGQADEELVNQLDISFTDPTQKYVSVQTTPWRDEASISQVGSVKAKALDLTWVQSYTQGRRLADRAMQRLNALMSGSFTTTLYGLRYLGKRWIGLQYPFVSGLQDCVVEIQNAEIDLASDRITWTFLRIAPDFIEAYDPDTDEGTAPPVPPSNADVWLLREDSTVYVREDGSNYVRENS